MATTVADADVLIRADVTKFAGDLRKKLLPILRALNVTLDILADATAFNRTVDDAVSDADSKNATIKVGADTSSIGRQVTAARNDIDGQRAVLRVDVDIDQDLDRAGGSFVRRFESLGGQSGKAFSSTLTKTTVNGMSSFGDTVSALFSNPIVIGAAVAVAAILLIPAAALIAATAIGGIGLAFLGLGAFALRGNAEVVGAFETLSKRISKVFTEAAEPLIKPLVKAFDTIGKAVEKIGPQLEGAFENLAPLIEDLADGFAGFIENVMPGFIELLEASAPLIKEFADQLPALGDALSTFFEILALAGPDSVDALKVAFGLLKLVLIAVASTILGLTLAFGLLKDALVFVVDLINDFLVAVTGFDLTTIGLLIQQFAVAGIQAIGDFISAATQFLGTLPAIFGTFISQAVNNGLSFLTNGFNQMVTLATSLPGRIRTAVSSLPGTLSSLFSQAVNAAAGQLSAGVGRLRNIAASIPNTIRSVLTGLGSILVSAGRSIIDGLIRGINERIGSLRKALSTITALIPQIKGPENVDKKLLTPAGRFIMEGLIAGIDEGVSGLERKLQGITTMFAPAVSAVAPQNVPGQSIGQSVGDAPRSSTSNSRTFSPIINVTVQGGGGGDATANAIVRRLLSVGV